MVEIRKMNYLNAPKGSLMVVLANVDNELAHYGQLGELENTYLWAYSEAMKNASLGRAIIVNSATYISEKKKYEVDGPSVGVIFCYDHNGVCSFSDFAAGFNELLRDCPKKIDIYMHLPAPIYNNQLRLLNEIDNKVILCV